MISIRRRNVRKATVSEEPVLSSRNQMSAPNQCQLIDSTSNTNWTKPFHSIWFQLPFKPGNSRTYVRNQLVFWWFKNGIFLWLPHWSKQGHNNIKKMRWNVCASINSIRIRIKSRKNSIQRVMNIEKKEVPFEDTKVTLTLNCLAVKSV